MSKGSFELYKDQSGQYRFRLKASNGEILCSSEAYSSKAKAQEGIASVRTFAVNAPVVEKDK
jgi:hypothetical protein